MYIENKFLADFQQNSFYYFYMNNELQKIMFGLSLSFTRS